MTKTIKHLIKCTFCNKSDHVEYLGGLDWFCNKRCHYKYIHKNDNQEEHYKNEKYVEENK